jgi:hypothetical protein
MVGAYSKARRSALKSVGGLWYEDILPLHFEMSAITKYRYVKRTDDHLRKKRRRYGHERPNVFTGRLRDKMLGKMPRVRVTKEGMKIVWGGLPRYAYVTSTIETITTKGGDVRAVVVKRPDKGAELTAVNKADRVVLGRRFKEEFLRAIDS